MSTTHQKEKIKEALLVCSQGSLRDSARSLFASLGYVSKKQVDLYPNSSEAFLEQFDPEGHINHTHALIDQWQSVDILFQLTTDEVRDSIQEQLSFGKSHVDKGIIQSYLFLAIDLSGSRYSRLQLVALTREINKLFPMPVLVLFRHESSMTLAIIDRRASKRDESRDVLERVTLIKDIACKDPLRAHIDILNDLSLPELFDEFNFTDWEGLHKSWVKRLDTAHLNERFYRDIANWYFWAVDHPSLVPPRNVKSEEERSIFVIRLITRLIFCWFLQEKGLMPKDLFRGYVIQQWLHDVEALSGTYYKAILQNLFFATLNQPVKERGFRKKKGEDAWYDRNRGVTNLYRYRNLLRDSEGFLQGLREVPFVNGGLFDCLDVVYRIDENRPNIRLDDFSEESANELCVPNELLFGTQHDVDLSEVYQDKRKAREKVWPLIEILSRYKFTVEENTPLEQEIALDPELLGKVFENLLASYNEDTRSTARKATGSFYTPREVVSFMVDETLIAYLVRQVGGGHSDFEAKLRQLFTSTAGTLQNQLSDQEVKELIGAIDRIKILDHACGSGAFPMGALHRLVDLLTKLDPNNARWKRQQLDRARGDRAFANQMQDDENRENALRDVEDRIEDIEHSFNTRFHALDFARKLYLIENCIYGVDVQPIACQIAKLRFFIALIVDQKIDRKAENFGVRPLPNLETKIVAADSLIPVEQKEEHQTELFDDKIFKLREKLELNRHEYFGARTPERKLKCRKTDAKIRKEIADVLKEGGLHGKTASMLAAWDPYDQNSHATFFDPAWMFSIRDGFDVVMGNPPYVRQEQIKELKPLLKKHYNCFTGTADLYVYFYERGIQLLKEGGAFSFITSNKWFRSAYGEKLRGWLANHTILKSIIDFGDAPVFTAIAYPSIVVLTKERMSQTELGRHEIRALNWQLGSAVEQFPKIFSEQNFPLSQASLKPNGWQLEGSSKLKLLERIRGAGIPLGEYVKGRFYYGIKTGLNEAFVIDSATQARLIKEHTSSKDIIKPFLRGRDVKRWRVEPQDLWLIFTRRGLDIKQYPAVHAYLKPFKEQLLPKPDKWPTNKSWPGRKAGSYKWYEIQDNIAYWAEFEQAKIVVPAITDYVNYAPDYDGYFSNDKTSIILPPSVPYLLAILNSQVSWWATQQSFASKQGGFYEFKPMYFSQLSIPTASSQQQEIIERVANYLIWLKQPGGSYTPVTENYLEQLLNGLVYELFFPEDLHAQKLFMFGHTEKAKLPHIANIPKQKRSGLIQETFQRISDLNHPIRSCLFSLRSLEVVRLIEGEA